MTDEQELTWKDVEQSTQTILRTATVVRSLERQTERDRPPFTTWWFLTNLAKMGKAEASILVYECALWQIYYTYQHFLPLLDELYERQPYGGNYVGYLRGIELEDLSEHEQDIYATWRAHSIGVRDCTEIVGKTHPLGRRHRDEFYDLVRDLCDLVGGLDEKQMASPRDQENLEAAQHAAEKLLEELRE
jgi:hypothetical protein